MSKRKARPGEIRNIIKAEEFRMSQEESANLAGSLREKLKYSGITQQFYEFVDLILNHLPPIEDYVDTYPKGYIPVSIWE